MLPASGARTRVRSPFMMFSKKKGVGSFFSWGGLPTTQPPTSVRSFFFENHSCFRQKKKTGRAASPLQLPVFGFGTSAASRAARLCGDDSLRSALGALALPRRRAIHLDVGSCVHLAVGSSLSRAVPRLVYGL